MDSVELRRFNLQRGDTVTILDTDDGTHHVVVLAVDGYSVKTALHTFLIHNIRSLTIAKRAKVIPKDEGWYQPKRDKAMGERVRVFYVLECGLWYSHHGTFTKRVLEDDLPGDLVHIPLPE